VLPLPLAMTRTPIATSFEFDTLLVDEFGQPQERRRSTCEGLREPLGTGIDLDLVTLPAGEFAMGSPAAEEGRHASQMPQHCVTLSSFSIGRFPVTQAQWRIIAAQPPIKQSLPLQPSCFTGDQRPVEQVSWYDALEFCARLSQLTGRLYRLPSEAEWEYACRAGTTTPFCFGPTITTDLANYSGIDWDYQGRICSKGSYGKGPTGTDRRETTDVGYFQVANAFGLYDMHGLVREWCEDLWHSSYAGAPSDGTAWLMGGDSEQRVLRGGSWNGSPKVCRSAFRSKLDPDSTLYDVGFRVVLAS